MFFALLSILIFLFPTSKSLLFLLSLPFSSFIFNIFNSLISVLAQQNSSYLPVVLVHGIFGSTSDMVDVVQWIEKDYPGIFVYNAEIGNGEWDRYVKQKKKRKREKGEKRTKKSFLIFFELFSFLLVFGTFLFPFSFSQFFFSDDILLSVFMNINEQVHTLAIELQKVPELKNGFDLIGKQKEKKTEPKKEKEREKEKKKGKKRKPKAKKKRKRKRK